MKPLHSETIEPTDGWAPLAAGMTVLTLVTLTASGGNVQVRRGDLEQSSTIADGASISLVGVNLRDIQVNVPAEASLGVIGS